MDPWPPFYHYTFLTLETQMWLKFIEVGPQTYKLLSKMHFKFWKPTKGHNSKIMGPWPLFCDYTLPTLETKCSISFIEVGPPTLKLLSKMYFNFAVMEWRKDMANPV